MARKNKLPTSEEKLAEFGLALSKDQDEAIDRLLAFLSSEDNYYFGLYGYAGTGKSTIIQTLLMEARRKADPPRVALSAPTHKAVGVISEMCRQFRTSSYFLGTVHSLLELSKVYDRSDGSVSFKPKSKGRRIRGVDVLVIDECSMVDKQLHEYIVQGVDKRSIKCIYMGDALQLPPVNEPESGTFKIVDASFELTEVVRHHGVLAETVHRVRQSIVNRSSRYSRFDLATNAQDEKGRVACMDRLAWGRQFLEEYEEGKRVRALAWTNNRVTRINNWIREQIYGKNPAQWIPGEKLVAVETFGKGALVKGKAGNVVMHTEAECTVVSAESGEYYAVPCWILTVDYLGVEMVIRVLDNTQRKTYRSVVEAARQKGIKDKNWSLYFVLKEAFAEMRVAYATTVHKAQGSTYDSVYVHQQDLLRNPNDYERGRLLYVAYSRARTGLYLT